MRRIAAMFTAYIAVNDDVYPRTGQLATISLAGRTLGGSARRCPPSTGSTDRSDGRPGFRVASRGGAGDTDARCSEIERDRGGKTPGRSGAFVYCPSSRHGYWRDGVDRPACRRCRRDDAGRDPTIRSTFVQRSLVRLARRAVSDRPKRQRDEWRWGQHEALRTSTVDQGRNSTASTTSSDVQSSPLPVAKLGSISRPYDLSKSRSGFRPTSPFLCPDLPARL